MSAEHGCGEFSNVVEHVVGQTKSRSKGSGYTLGQMNQYLDELTGLPLKAQERKEKARMTALKASSPDGKKKKHKKQKKVKTIKSLMDMRAGWLRKLNEGRDGKLGLSPLEHKWLCRILIRNMKLTLVRSFLAVFLQMHHWCFDFSICFEFCSFCTFFVMDYEILIIILFLH